MYLQMCPQMSMVTLVIGCIFLSFVHCVFFSSNVYCKNRDQNITWIRTGKVAFFVLFSTVCFQMSPQIVCRNKGKVTFVAFIWLFGHTIWGEIWKHTVEKSTKNAINATLPFLIQVIWVNIWNHTVGKSQINETNVTLALFAQTKMQ